MAGPLLVGIDIGTSRIRALLVDQAGRVRGEAARPTPGFAPRPGWLSHDPETLWQTTAQVLGQLSAAAPEREAIAGVAVASFGESAVLVDGAGAPVAPAIAWFDERSRGEMAGLPAAGLSLLPPDPTYGLLKLLWMRRHEPGFARARRWLNVADWIGFRLSGVMASEVSLASRSMALDLSRGAWNGALLDGLGLAHLPAPLRASGSPLGTVTAAAAAASGLPRRAVVGVGGHDHLCGALAAGVIAPGILLDSLGTAEVMVQTMPAPVAAPEAVARGFAQGLIRVVPDLELAYLLGAIPASGASVEWFRAACAGGASHETLIAEAGPVAPGAGGVVFLPHLRLAATPDPDPGARGAFLGLSAATGRGALYRAVLEGLALESRMVLEAMAALPGMAPPRAIRLTGGMTRNPLFLAIKAAVLGRPLARLAEAEGSALGAAMLAGLAAGVWPDLPAALGAVGVAAAEIHPAAGWVDCYDKLFAGAYRHLHSALKPLHHALLGAGAEAPAYP